MRNLDNPPSFDQPDIQDEIKTHAEAMYSPEKLTSAYINQMFGLKDGTLSDAELANLGKLFKEKGEILFRANLEKNTFNDVGEIKNAIRKHVEDYSSFGAHDVVHVIIEANLGKGEEGPDSPVPEFLRKNSNNLQAIREEFPAVLWTPIGDQKPIFVDLMNGSTATVLGTLRKKYNGKKVDELNSLFNSMDAENFESVCHAYTEVLLYLAYKVAKKEANLSEPALTEWKNSYRQDQDIIRQSLNKNIKEYMETGKFSFNTKGDRTEQLFIEQAYSIFSNFKADEKVIYNNFMLLAQRASEY